MSATSYGGAYGEWAKRISDPDWTLRGGQLHYIGPTPRVCSAKDCDTELNSYNLGDKCLTCTNISEVTRSENVRKAHENGR